MCGKKQSIKIWADGGGAWWWVGGVKIHLNWKCKLLYGLCLCTGG